MLPEIRFQQARFEMAKTGRSDPSIRGTPVLP